ncbi:MAG: ATP-binding protein, partial [Thermoguttaceae bacterium]|nr:ATP-binding protein [Thermoguttaceae bacterium]
MLLGFSCKNFKTYREETVFSMVPDRVRTRPECLLSASLNEKQVKALPTSVIYGPNASGKTNIIAGMDFLRCIVLSGNIQNIQNFGSINPVIANPGMAPNLQNENDPVELAVEFVSQGLKIEYRIGMQLNSKEGVRIGRSPSPRITEERLIVSDVDVFVRTEEHLEIKLKTIKPFLIDGWDKAALDMAQRNIQKADLFLCNGFKSLISQKITEIIIHWFLFSFRTFYSFHQIHSYPVGIPTGEITPLAAELEGAVKCFGINQNRIAFYRDDQHSGPVKVSFVKNEPIPAVLYESLGTLRFLDMFPLIMDAFKYGQTLVFDEFDASIHPLAVRNIIGAFHNDEVNVNRAQLIFNTHNPMFLDSNLFRRDEIKFVDRNDETGESELYQLSNFRNE